MPDYPLPHREAAGNKSCDSNCWATCMTLCLGRRNVAGMPLHKGDSSYKHGLGKGGGSLRTWVLNREVFRPAYYLVTWDTGSRPLWSCAKFSWVRLDSLVSCALLITVNSCNCGTSWWAQHDRNIEEGNSGDHTAQPLAQSRVSYSKLLTIVSSWVLTSSTIDGDSTMCLGNLFQCLMTLHYNSFFLHI